jgi:hypothetical protein
LKIMRCLANVPYHSNTCACAPERARCYTPYSRKSGESLKKGKSKRNWKTRVKGTNAQIGTHYVEEPRGDKSNLPKGLLVVTPPVARRLELAWVKTNNIPKTDYKNKKDNERIAEFMDMIARGIPLAPPVIHILPNGDYEVIDGKHKVEAYRRLGYKKFPATMNATVAEIAKALGDDYEEFLHMQPRTFAEKSDLARRAITAQRGNPLVTEDTAGAFDALNPLSSGETQVAEIIADKKRRVVKSGDLVTGKKSGEMWRTRTAGTESQKGTHFIAEPHGDKSALPKGVEAVAQPMTPTPLAGVAKTDESAQKGVAEKLEELDKKLKESEKEKDRLKKDLAKAKEETPEQKREREYREKALTIAEHESAKMRERKRKREEKAKAKAEAEKETKKLLDKAIPNTETMGNAKEYGTEAQVMKRQENWRKRGER